VQAFVRRGPFQRSALDDLGVTAEQHDAQVLFGFCLRRERAVHIGSGGVVAPPKPTHGLTFGIDAGKNRDRDRADGPELATGLRDNEDFLERYARAREEQADKYFQEIIEIADAATPETVNVARLRVDSRKFTVARLAPKKYGDHISHNVKGAGSTNFQPQILIQCSSAGDDEGYIDISAAPKQLVAIRSKATEIPYRGAAGGGKPHLMRAAA
jgi:hypothetical protein